VELIVGIICLNEGLYSLLQATLLGSILSNLLIVLGTSFFVGGLYHETQKFDAHFARMSATMLALAVLSLLVPAAYVASVSTSDLPYVAQISHGTAVMLIIIYILFLFFQLTFHKRKREDGGVAVIEIEDEEVPEMSLALSIVALGVITILVSICSEYLVDALETGNSSWNLSVTFVGMILLPIIGNAAEHASAVYFAMKNKMDLSVNIALSSSIQIALFVTPFLVIISWITGGSLDLLFNDFQTAILFISVLIVNYILGGGSSNWLQGAMCLTGYVVIGIASFYFYD